MNFWTIEVEGMRFRVECEQDLDMREPWKEHDCYGPVSEWTDRKKRPGEWVLAKNGERCLLYDAQATAARLLKEWGDTPTEKRLLPDGRLHQPTKRQAVAKAVQQEFDHLKAWCDDEWHWAQITVTLLDVNGRPTPEQESCGGIDSDNDADYLEDVAERLAREIAGRVPDVLMVRVREQATK